MVLEFFSQYCLTCQRQGPYIESFTQTIAKGDLAGKIRVLAVGVGSRAKDLQRFRRGLEITYPIAPDPYFERMIELGDPGRLDRTEYGMQQAAGNAGVRDHDLVAGRTQPAGEPVAILRPRLRRALRELALLLPFQRDQRIWL